MTTFLVTCLYKHDYTISKYPVTTKKTPARFLSHCIRSYAEDIRLTYRMERATKDVVNSWDIPSYAVHIGKTIIDIGWSEYKGMVMVLVSRVKGHNNFTGRDEYMFNTFYV